MEAVTSAPSEPTIEEKDEGQDKKSRGFDPEILILSQMVRKLDELEDEKAKARIVRYIHQRFFQESM